MVGQLERAPGGVPASDGGVGVRLLGDGVRDATRTVVNGAPAGWAIRWVGVSEGPPAVGFVFHREAVILAAGL